MRKMTSIGLFLFAVVLTAQRFFPVPEAVTGFGLGLAICFELLGMLPEEKYNKLRDWKRKQFRAGRR